MRELVLQGVAFQRFCHIRSGMRRGGGHPGQARGGGVSDHSLPRHPPVRRRHMLNEG